jgi:hypothetical protein
VPGKPLLTADVMFSILADRTAMPDRVGAKTQYQLSAEKLVADAIRTRKRGRIGGPLVSRHVVAGFGSLRIEENFQAQKVAIVYAEGGSGGNLDMVVRNAANKILCEDREPTDRMLCKWEVASARSASIEIINLNSKPQAFLFITN